MNIKVLCQGCFVSSLHILIVIRVVAGKLLFVAMYSLAFAGSADILCLLDITIKEKSVRFIEVYISNDNRELFFSLD